MHESLLLSLLIIPSLNNILNENLVACLNLGTLMKPMNWVLLWQSQVTVTKFRRSHDFGTFVRIYIEPKFRDFSVFLKVSISIFSIYFYINHFQQKNTNVPKVIAPGRNIFT